MQFINYSHVFRVLILTFISVSCISAQNNHNMAYNGIENSTIQDSQSKTIAVWLFDEPEGLYPSSVINDVGPNDYLMVLGRGGAITKGKFGNALSVIDPIPYDIPDGDFNQMFGLSDVPVPAYRTVKPMVWENANFSALITSGESHLRKQLGFSQVTRTKLNLGNFDWTVEFWLQLSNQTERNDGVIFEIGEGPRAENDRITQLLLNKDLYGFTFVNAPTSTQLQIPMSQSFSESAESDWTHFAFTYTSSQQQLKLYVDGKLQTLPEKVNVQPLNIGAEDYFTVGRDANWKKPLDAKIDELRFSEGLVYNNEFNSPNSFSSKYLKSFPLNPLEKGDSLLFAQQHDKDVVVPLRSRKYLFIDDALVDSSHNITYRMNPPKIDQMVMKIEGINEISSGRQRAFRKHMTLIEDEDGRIRIYNALEGDNLAVWLSDDGVNFYAPDTGIEHEGNKNIVIPDNVGIGTMIIDPNAPPEARWKYIADYRRRGMYVYTSPDGYNFERHKQPVSPFRSGSQPDIYYDDQRHTYVGFHRSDFYRNPYGQTSRTFVLTEMQDLMQTWPYSPATPDNYTKAGENLILNDLSPWYLDNGPLTPGGWGVEYPVIFEPNFDTDTPMTAGIYNPKAIKYPWAPDTYLAFPIYYFYYYDGYPGQKVLGLRYGGGPTETQFSASRDGLKWNRFPRPAYVGMGRFDDIPMMQSYIAQGMVKRNDEIWQYVFLDGDYHTSEIERLYQRRVFRLIQRFDGFVSADAPYDDHADIITKPLIFDGDRLLLNIKTDAQGYAFVSLLDEDGNPIEGFSLEESVMINGDHMSIEAEWITQGMDFLTKDGKLNKDEVDIRTSSDISKLDGQTVRLHIRMRGSSLFSIQFTDTTK